MGQSVCVPASDVGLGIEGEYYVQYGIVAFSEQGIEVVAGQASEKVVFLVHLCLWAEEVLSVEQGAVTGVFTVHVWCPMEADFVRDVI